jgi:hypothetical protein
MWSVQTVDGLNVLTCFSAVLMLLPNRRDVDDDRLFKQEPNCPEPKQGSLVSDASVSPPTKSKELGSRLRQGEAISRVLEVQVATWADNAVKNPSQPSLC